MKFFSFLFGYYETSNKEYTRTKNRRNYLMFEFLGEVLPSVCVCVCIYKYIYNGHIDMTIIYIL
jgi:hypothetical protein